MRIRRKKHLKERLLELNDYVIVPERDIANVKEAVKNKKYFDYEKIFSNNNPVELEVGCGKGGFIIAKAMRNPNVNFIAVELLENIIVMAGEKAKEKNLKNLVFVNSGAEYLPRYIKENSIQKIYLNFSPPYPQSAYESHRLTCERNVLSYKDYLIEGGAIYQKTDDKPFFDYSFEMFKNCGFSVLDVSDKLDDRSYDNIITEYEKKFRDLGMPIYALIARK